jgi:hypothetical protein
MSSIEGIDQIGEAAARIEIQGPENEASREQREIEAAIADARKDLPPREDTVLTVPAGTQSLQQIPGGMEAVRDADRVVTEDGVVLKERFLVGTTALEAVEQAVEEEGLFDDSAYVAVPEVDGQATDQIVIAFSGSVAYDASDEQGAKLYQDLKLGKAVELRVAGYVAGKAGGYKVTAREEEVVTGKVSVRIDTLYLLTPERLN